MIATCLAVTDYGEPITPTNTHTFPYLRPMALTPFERAMARILPEEEKGQLQIKS
jgi:hypothetical protein